MNKAASDFLYRFHHLEGSSIGARKKELTSLLCEYDSLKQEVSTLDDILHNLKATTYLQQKFVVNILIYCRRYSELLKIFTGENEALMKPLWKQIWFFEKLLQENSADFIAYSLFQHLSYVTRMRFLRNVTAYTKDESNIDKLHECVSHKYGSICANVILPGCSLKKILEILKDQKPKFDNKQLFFLHKYKRDNLTQLIESEYGQQVFDFYDHNSKALAIIAGSDFKFFFNIFKNNKCSSIGKRLTKKVLNLERDYIVNKAADTHRCLHPRTLVRELKSDFKKFLWDTWPRSFKSFNLYSCSRLTRYYPKMKYFELVQEGLKEVYGESISDHPELIDDKFLKYNKDIRIRESLLEIKMKHSKEEYTLAQYYSIDKSIPILKKKISAADGVKTRENLIEALVNTCKHNDDPDSLLEVQKYFSLRHRNDDQSIRSSFLNEIKNCFDLTQLTDSHWEYILELIEWSETRNQKVWGSGEIYMLYIKFLYKTNKPLEYIKNILLTHLSDINDFRNKWSIIKDIPKLEKYVLITFIDSYASMSMDEQEKINIMFELFEVILDWNKRHPEDFIDFSSYPVIKDTIKAKFKKPRSCTTYMNNFIQGKILCEDKQFLEDIECILWENFSGYFSTNIVEYYLRKNPSKILEQFTTFISVVSDKFICDSLCIWRLLKHYDHMGLPHKIIDFLKEKELGSINRVVGIAFATLMDPDEYIMMMSRTETTKINQEDSEECSGYRLVNRLLEFMKYVNSNSVLPKVVEFCEGDYLHTALTPLYYHFFHTAEKHLSIHLQILATRAVSVRKHAVKLACSVMPIEIVYNLIKQIMDNEKNQSVIEHLFNKTFKYFLKQPSEEFWSLIQLQIRALDILESNAFKEACSMKIIPEKYKMSYLTFLWGLLDEIQEQGHDVSDIKEKLIKSLSPEIIRNLEYIFCSNLIKENFMRFDGKKDKSMNAFVLNCMKYGEHKERILEDIFAIMSEFKKNYILHPEFNVSSKSYSYISQFISDVFYDFSNDAYLDHGLVVLFHSHWIKVFTPRENINDYILITLLLELKEMKDTNSYVLKLAKLFNDFVEEYGILGIIDCFTSALNFTLPDFLSIKYEEKKYQLALKLVELQYNVYTNLLAINLLPEEIPENVECKKIFHNVLEVLGRSEDNILKINLDLFIRSLRG